MGEALGVRLGLGLGHVTPRRTSSFSPAKNASRQCLTLLGSPLLMTERGNEGASRASGRLSSQNTSYLRPRAMLHALWPTICPVITPYRTLSSRQA